jgi:hypothetical protein
MKEERKYIEEKSVEDESEDRPAKPQVNSILFLSFMQI